MGRSALQGARGEHARARQANDACRMASRRPCQCPSRSRSSRLRTHRRSSRRVQSLSADFTDGRRVPGNARPPGLGIRVARGRAKPSWSRRRDSWTIRGSIFVGTLPPTRCTLWSDIGDETSGISRFSSPSTIRRPIETVERHHDVRFPSGHGADRTHLRERAGCCSLVGQVDVMRSVAVRVCIVAGLYRAAAVRAVARAQGASRGRRAGRSVGDLAKREHRYLIGSRRDGALARCNPGPGALQGATSGQRERQPVGAVLASRRAGRDAGARRQPWKSCRRQA